MKVQSAKSLIAEMRAVARGERKAPADATEPSAESAQALLRLQTPTSNSHVRAP